MHIEAELAPRSDLRWRRLAASALKSDPATRQSWDRLNRGRLGLPFLSADAVAAALAAFGNGTETLLVGEAGSEARAMFVLEKQGSMRWASFHPSQLPLGAWVAEAGRGLPALCRSLMRGPLWPCLVLSITSVDPLVAARDADEADTLHADYIETAWIDVAGSFDDYWAARGKNLRQNMRKQRNKLAADGVATTLLTLREPAEMAGVVARYGALESAGWKAGEGTAIHADNAQGRFYTRLLEDAAQRGEALAFEYLFGDRSVAINLCLLHEATLVVLKTTYDETIPKALSPAFLLREDELRLIHGSNEIRRIEYYGRVMDWHTKLTANRRSLHHLTAYRWPWLKRLAQRRRTDASVGAETAVAAAEGESAAQAG